MPDRHLFWIRVGASLRENALLVAAYLVDREKIRETGANRGYWVERFLRGVGLGPGYAWCAAFVAFALREAGWTDIPRGAAAVRNWAAWADRTGRHVAQPERGDLFYWLDPATKLGHIGFVVEASGGFLRTIEGNTSSGERGNQRDGDGAYRRTRVVTPGMRFISLR
jgi:hypothetical protein